MQGLDGCGVGLSDPIEAVAPVGLLGFNCSLMQQVTDQFCMVSADGNGDWLGCCCHVVVLGETV